METECSFRVHKSPPPVPILSQMTPIHIPKPYFLYVKVGVILFVSLTSQLAGLRLLVFFKQVV
jgi:hypothetical protein